MKAISSKWTSHFFPRNKPPFLGKQQFRQVREAHGGVDRLLEMAGKVGNPRGWKQTKNGQKPSKGWLSLGYNGRNIETYLSKFQFGFVFCWFLLVVVFGELMEKWKEYQLKDPKYYRMLSNVTTEVSETQERLGGRKVPFVKGLQLGLPVLLGSLLCEKPKVFGGFGGDVLGPKSPFLDGYGEISKFSRLAEGLFSGKGEVLVQL